MLESELPEIPGAAFRERVRRAWGHFDRLVALLGELPRRDPETPLLVLGREQLVEIDAWLSEAWKQCRPCDETLHKIEDEFRELHQLEQSLEDFTGLDIDLGRLQGQHEHLDMRIGSVPAAKVDPTLNTAADGKVVALLDGEDVAAHVAHRGDALHQDALLLHGNP